MGACRAWAQGLAGGGWGQGFVATQHLVCISPNTLCTAPNTLCTSPNTLCASPNTLCVPHPTHCVPHPTLPPFASWLAPTLQCCHVGVLGEVLRWGQMGQVG